MSEEDSPHPLEDLIAEAREGRLTLDMGNGSPDTMRVNAEEFVYIERDCEGFKLLIQELQTLAEDISNRKKWDLGEAAGGLVSAETLVSRFRAKGKGAEDANSVYEILEQHYQIVEDIQEVHRIMAQRYMESDETFAARYNELMASAPPPGALALPPAFPIPPSV
ncbi:hypothetical protein AB0H60_28850 [Nocardia rhamnosiphila]|uniref:hypothetical protein n=1 Tax=Nocardia rhamnosiphila TaxID=426716 RepID=UPI00340E219F